MKNMKLLTIICCIALFLGSCKKEQNTVKENTQTDVIKKNQNMVSYLGNEYWTYPEVDATLDEMGATEVGIPLSFVPTFTDYQTIHKYTRGSEIFYVYVYDTAEDIYAAEGGDNTCTNAWHDPCSNCSPVVEEGCYNSGSSCRIKVNTDNTWEIKCCN